MMRHMVKNVIDVNFGLRKKLHSVILVSFLARNILTLMPNNGTVWINVGKLF